MILLWFILTGVSWLFVVLDIPSTPAPPVIKLAFIILVAFTGPFGAFLYVLGCREPLKYTHEAYVAARWRQVLGSTMHCAAGDGIGIIAGAALAAFIHISGWSDLVLEYALGFGFGWAFFQAFAMRDMVGGSYAKSLKITFLPEFLSMNLLMAGMAAAASAFKLVVAGSNSPLRPGFWFVMSIALIAGFVLAYPMNWWLVGRGLKHGMFTVRSGSEKQRAYEAPAGTSMSLAHSPTPPFPATMMAMTALSVFVLVLGITVSRFLGT